MRRDEVEDVDEITEITEIEEITEVDDLSEISRLIEMGVLTEVDEHGPVDAGILDLEFSGAVWFWRGPSPFFFVVLPDAPSAAVHAVSGVASYGWGCIPVRAQIGHSDFRTALIPKDGRYLLPLRKVIRMAEGLDEGDVVPVRMVVGP